MVLGVDWIREIHPVTFDFQNLTLQFSHGETNLMLQGTNDSASLRVIIGLEILETISIAEDPWLTHLNIIHCESTIADIPRSLTRIKGVTPQMNS